MYDEFESAYVSVKEVASNVGVSYLTALHWIRDGKIQSLTRGGRRLVHKDELARFMREGNHPTSKSTEGTKC